MSLIEKYLGTDDAEGLRQLVGRRHENEELECKSYTENIIAKSIRKDIIAALIGFLNRLDGSGGLLMIGVQASHGLIERIAPVIAAETNLEALRSSILDTISSVPYRPQPFDLVYRPINFEGGKVILVEVHTSRDDVVFYSRSMNVSYMRKGDSTYILKLEDTFQLVLARSKPKPYFAIFHRYPVDAQTTEQQSFALNIGNDGSVVGMNVFCRIRVSATPGSSIDLVGTNIRLTSSEGVSNDRSYSFGTGFPPNSYPLYPGVLFHVGELKVVTTIGSLSHIFIEIFEHKGKTEQILEINHLEDPIVEEKSRRYSIYT